MQLPSFQSALLSQPSQGAMVMAMALDFTNVAAINIDVTEEILSQKIDFIQSVYIDNSLNASQVTLKFVDGISTAGYLVTAQPYSQGWYPVAVPVGKLVFVAGTAQGIIINIKLANIAMPYFTWGQTPGALVVPALTNSAYAVEPLIAGDNVLVAGIAAETIKLYRGILSFGGATLVKFTDGPAGTLLFAATLFAGGSVTFQASGTPWFSGTAGKSLILNSSNAVNMYGGIGYVIS
jgi:hypothetical protein